MVMLHSKKHNITLAYELATIIKNYIWFSNKKVYKAVYIAKMWSCPEEFTI